MRCEGCIQLKGRLTRKPEFQNDEMTLDVHLADSFWRALLKAGSRKGNYSTCPYDKSPEILPAAKKSRILAVAGRCLLSYIYNFSGFSDSSHSASRWDLCGRESRGPAQCR